MAVFQDGAGLTYTAASQEAEDSQAPRPSHTRGQGCAITVPYGHDFRRYGHGVRSRKRVPTE